MFVEGPLEDSTLCAMAQRKPLSGLYPAPPATHRTSGSAVTTAPASASPMVRAMFRPPGHTLQQRGKQRGTH